MFSERTFWIGLVVIMGIAVPVGYGILSWGGRSVDWSLVLLYVVLAGGAYLVFIRDFIRPSRRNKQ